MSKLPLPVKPAATLAVCLVAALLASAPALAHKEGPPSIKPLVVAPTIEGLYLCEEASKEERIADIEAAAALCHTRQRNAAPAIKALLDELEPGGPQGQVQLGFTLTLQLLGLYEQDGQGQWSINQQRLRAAMQLVEDVPRPVVLYLAADHFDTLGALPQALAKDPASLMLLPNGQPPELGYFGYRILPYTLSTDPAITVNKYRFEALEQVAKAVQMLPQAAQQRIVAINLLGELHHMFPDFEGGMGMQLAMQTTDYSPRSVAGFRQWLQAKYSTVQELEQHTGLRYASFEEVPAPGKDIRSMPLQSFGEHYDSYAAGYLTLGGWLWDPQQHIQRLELYVDGQSKGPVQWGMNRLDVYRAVDEVLTPNTGYRVDFDYSSLRPGKHMAQIVAHTSKGPHLLEQRAFAVLPPNQAAVGKHQPRGLRRLSGSAHKLAGVRTYMDTPAEQQDLYYNPLARDWNAYREQQVYDFLHAFYQRAVQAGLPANKLYSHQIVPGVNSSWNGQLFAADTTLHGQTPWKQGLNMYGGAVHSPWMQAFIAQRGIRDYGVPEFHPQQWKRPGAHLAALESHLDAGARFIAPYYFSVVPERFKGGAEQGVNRMELGPDNSKDGSDQFYRALKEFVRR